MRTLVRWSLMLPILLASANLHAQWTNVAPKIIPDPYSIDPNGAMFFRDGIIWAGVNLLWNSVDSGTTWAQCKSFPSAIISDIVFYDNLHGLVSTKDQGVFITSDGGFSWLQWLKTANLVKVGYDGSFLDIITLEIDGPIHISHDGGLTWGGAPLANYTYHSFAVAQDGTLYLDGYGNVLTSNNAGVTWNAEAGTYNSDCWTLSVDSCNPKQLYLANEEIRDPLSTSNFYRSTDGGQSWQSKDTHSKPYLSGAMATTHDAIILGTMDGSGLHRSMDLGLTWKSIGGPTMPFDTRSIAVINDNFILAADSAGNIWRTTNGGGDSVASVPYYSGTVSTTPHKLFVNDTLHCDSLKGTVQLQRSSCAPPANFFITGPDSGSFRMVDSTADSISVLWTSQKPGTVQAWLVTQTITGIRDSVSLSGYSTTPPTSYSIPPANFFSGDSLYIGCDPAVPVELVIFDTACLWPDVFSEHILGPGAKNYSLVKPSDHTLIDSDIVQISFLPTDSGNDSAVYQLILNDGTTFLIPLLGSGFLTHAIQLSALAQNVKTDTIGGEVEIPILIDTFARSETVELSLEYPLADLAYDSTVDKNGIKVDIAGSQSSGHTRLRFTTDPTGIVTLYARFKVFSDSDYNPIITFDDLTVPTQLATCAYSYPPLLTDTIQPLEGCAVQMLSRWVHLGQMPLFRIIPNPTHDGNVTITSTRSIGTVLIDVYDELGTKRAFFMAPLNNGIPASLQLPFESGIYFLRITSARGISNQTVVIKQ